LVFIYCTPRKVPQEGNPKPRKVPVQAQPTPTTALFCGRRHLSAPMRAPRSWCAPAGGKLPAVPFVSGTGTESGPAIRFQTPALSRHPRSLAPPSKPAAFLSSQPSPRRRYGQRPEWRRRSGKKNPEWPGLRLQLTGAAKLGRFRSSSASSAGRQFIRTTRPGLGTLACLFRQRGHSLRKDM
jgi:hypothetical protein